MVYFRSLAGYYGGSHLSEIGLEGLRLPWDALDDARQTGVGTKTGTGTGTGTGTPRRSKFVEAASACAIIIIISL